MLPVREDASALSQAFRHHDVVSCTIFLAAWYPLHKQDWSTDCRMSFISLEESKGSYTIYLKENTFFDVVVVLF